MKQLIAIILIMVGLALLILGATWHYWHSPKLFWSAQQAKEHEDAWRALKGIATGGIRRADAASNANYAAARARFEMSESQLTRATALNNYTGNVFVVLGIGLTASGAWITKSLNELDA
jgi:hypothetical protein